MLFIGSSSPCDRHDGADFRLPSSFLPVNTDAARTCARTQIEGSTKLELFWSITPFLVMLVMFCVGSAALFCGAKPAERCDGSLCYRQTVDVEDSISRRDARDQRAPCSGRTAGETDAWRPKMSFTVFPFPRFGSGMTLCRGITTRCGSQPQNRADITCSAPNTAATSIRK